MMTTIAACRVAVAGIFATGAIWLCYAGKDGWGWMVVAAIILGSVSVSED
jgi:hypothetical protein